MQTMHTIYHEHLADQICHQVALTGLPDSSAALSCQVSPSTLSRWKTEHRDLEIRLRAARESFVASQITIIANARLANGRRDSRAARWLLTRILSTARTADGAPRLGFGFGPN